MSNRINYTVCPVCGSPGISKYLSVQDHSVSKEQFEIFHCANCQLRFTQDIPDKKTIGRYYQSEDYISHSDTAKGLVNRLYRIIRDWANVQKRKLVIKETGKKKGALLDVGSGTGYFAAAVKKAGWDVTGLEPDEGARSVASKQHRLELRPVEDLFVLPVESFDAITLWHVLEHVHDLKTYLRKFKELLTGEGKLFIAVPNYSSYDAAVYKEHWAAYDVPRHLYHFTPHTMKMLMIELGLKIVSVKPMWFDSFYVSLLSSRYKSGSTNWLGALWTGFISNIKAWGNVSKCSSVIYIISK
jgi:2-polyprenyl-3-methyl-5-hydroxy-6-metoxy-1,4-benzoquinol methylase